MQGLRVSSSSNGLMMLLSVPHYNYNCTTSRGSGRVQGLGTLVRMNIRPGRKTNSYTLTNHNDNGSNDIIAVIIYYK